MILYHDLQFLDDIIGRIYEHVDEIVLIDGPYLYSLELLKLCNLYYDETNKPDELTRIIAKYPKIKYTFGIFSNEEEKRILGYNSCSHDIILLVDADEFFTIDSNKLTDFLGQQDKFVAGFDIYNMSRINIQYNNTVKKFVLFNRLRISADDHLDYLWLVGCKTKEKIMAYMDTHTSYGTIHHQTLNRNKHNSIVKFIFYFSLFYKNSNEVPKLFNEYANERLLEICSRNELIDNFYHSLIVSIGIPEMAAGNICRVNDDVSFELTKYGQNHSPAYFKGNCKCLKGVQAFFLLDKGCSSTLQIKFENVKSIQVTIYEICIGALYRKHEFQYDTNEIVLTYKSCSLEILDTVIQFKCSETVDASPLFKILSIT
jgi:hypothetical protein